MTNPWEEISLSDYENHMSLDSVQQLQVMNRMMKEQFDAYPAPPGCPFLAHFNQ